MGNVESKGSDQQAASHAHKMMQRHKEYLEVTGMHPTRPQPIYPKQPSWEHIKTYIESCTLRDIVPSWSDPRVAKPLVALSARDNLHHCYRELVKHNIHGAPVYEEVSAAESDVGAQSKRRWIGMLDWRDFVSYVVRFLDQGEQIAATIGSQSAGEIAQDHPLNPVFEDASLLAILTGFGQAGVRRRPVIAKDAQADRILGMISQLDVIKWLSNRRREFSPAFEGISIQHVVEREQADYRFSKLRQVCSVMMDTRMSDVLGILAQSNLNGVSVVDHSGKLVANISVSDLQYVVEENLDYLFVSVQHFLEHMPRRPLVTCPPTATLMEVVDRLAAAEVYRIYVITEVGEPKAVITLTDVINAVLLLANHDATLSVTDISNK